MPPAALAKPTRPWSAPERAERLALLLHRTNRQRREVEMQILEEAEAMLAADRRAAGEKVIVLAGEGWPHGVIGIVASRLVERHCRPAVLVALEGDEGRGSARSIPGFDITAALDRCASLLERFGGHAAAAGFTIAPARVGELREALNRYAAPLLPEEKLRPFLELDTLLEPHEISLELARQLQLLEPFGTGNPRPLFCSAGWELKSWRLVGETQEHLKLNLACGEYRADPIFFRGAPLASALGRGRRFDLAFSSARELSWPARGGDGAEGSAQRRRRQLRQLPSSTGAAADRRTLLKEILSSVEGSRRPSLPAREPRGGGSGSCPRRRCRGLLFQQRRR